MKSLELLRLSLPAGNRALFRGSGIRGKERGRGRCGVKIRLLGTESEINNERGTLCAYDSSRNNERGVNACVAALTLAAFSGFEEAPNEPDPVTGRRPLKTGFTE